MKVNKLIKSISNKKCIKCNTVYEHRKHASITNKLLNKPYFFLEWDYCKPCGHIQHYEQYKITNR